MRWARWFLGLPHATGFFYGHPRAAPKEIGERTIRGPGYFERTAKGDLVLIPGTRASGSNAAVADEEAPAPSLWSEGRTTFEAGHVHAMERDTWREAFQAEGDEGSMSVSFAEDIWYLLTEQLGIGAVLCVEILAEVCVIVLFALLLTVAALAEAEADADGRGPAAAGDVFRDKMLLSLTSVRLSTDSIFGWQSRSASSGLEVAILAVQGWAHWLLLSVAGSIIVARALRPLKQVVFSPDCVLSDEDLCVRLQILRHDVVELLNLDINFQVISTGGRVHQLPLANGISGYAGWAGVSPLNIRHKIDENSPLRDDYPGGKLGIQYCRVSVSATDSNGNPVNASANYYHQDSFVASQSDWSSAWRARGLLPPRILSGVRWKDQLRRIRDKSTGQPITGMGLPIFLVNIDNFAEVEPIERLPV